MGIVRPTLLIVDDHAAFRASARALLEADGFEVIGEVADGVEAVQAVETLQPMIVLLDIQLIGVERLTSWHDGDPCQRRLGAWPDRSCRRGRHRRGRAAPGRSAAMDGDRSPI
jgi:CheY-like chemotaxis protein